MKDFDFVLAIISIFLLAAIGIVSLYGTGYSWLASLDNPNWTETFLYASYLEKMNKIAAPLVIALVIVLGLCIPKRLLSRKKMLIVSGFMLLFGLFFALLFQPLYGLAFILAAGIVIQFLVIFLIFFRATALRFERKGFLASLGSGLLHLGFLVFLFDFTLLQGWEKHLLVFWVSAFLVTLGSAFSFYSSEITRLFPRKK